MGGQCSKKRRSSGADKQTVNNMENDPNMLQKGIDFLTMATEEDKNRNYEEALRYYVEGVVILLHVAKYNIESQEAKDCVRKKCGLYIARIQKIKDYRNKNHGSGVVLEELETLLDSNMLCVVTEVISMCGDLMEL